MLPERFPGDFYSDYDHQILDLCHNRNVSALGHVLSSHFHNIRVHPGIGPSGAWKCRESGAVAPVMQHYILGKADVDQERYNGYWHARVALNDGQNGPVHVNIGLGYLHSYPGYNSVDPI